MNHQKSRIRLFFGRMRITNFAARITHEIHHRIFPVLRNEKDYGYPFQTDEEFLDEIANQKSELLRQIEFIEQKADSMGKAYGRAFRHIMYRELNSRMAMYVVAGKRRVQPSVCDPRFIARAA
jgi:hypothetical protein